MPDVQKIDAQNGDAPEAQRGACNTAVPDPYLENSSGRPDQPACSPSQGLSVTELMETVNGVSKMSIAHEIVVNQDFHMEEMALSPDSLESKIKETMHSAFWDHLREQLAATPPNYTYVLQLLKEIKESRLKSQIEEVMDMELLKQEADHGALDVSHLSTYILSMMTMLCAPIRDEEVEKLESISDPVLLLREIFHVLGLMKMDMVNFTIQSIRPHLQEHSIQYERAKFQELLQRMPNFLDHTAKWLSQAAAEVMTPPPPSYDPTEQITSSPADETVKGSPIISPSLVLNQGYMNLLHWDPDNEEFPETVMMDRTRLQEIQFQLNKLTILASVLLVTNSYCGPKLLSSPHFVDRLKQIIKVLLEGNQSRLHEALLSISDQVLQEIQQALVDLNLPALSKDDMASLSGQIHSVAKEDNCVHSIIDQRIRLFLKGCLIRGVQPSLRDLPGGITPIEEELAEMGQRFSCLILHNQQVFGPYYADILKKVLFSPQESEVSMDST
ncbi:T-complex protein 11 homolog isoform X2 [Vombatus ursinus]|uniref:T-complex protein 11 homolog isoform X2 n=1 Tax=Vombatus ursinus TaxID=29139 RepID=UPI000FFD4C03|nr:T-complex protein 11 homolog isoform X2 [Vombatus ursinus]